MGILWELKILNLLQKCTFKQLKQIHAFIITTLLDEDPQIRLKLLRRSTEFGSMEYADLVFFQMGGLYCTETTLWNAMIRGYAYNGPFEHCIKLFDEMPLRGLQPNNFTYPYVLSSCSQMGLFKNGRKVHCRIIKTGFGCVSSVANALFDFYVKRVNILGICVSQNEMLNDARNVFDGMCDRPVEAWNRMIGEYVGICDLESARCLFDCMSERDVVSWNTMISGYAKIRDVANARELFEQMPERSVVSWTTMIQVYARVGDVQTARKFFERMPERNLVSWNCMMSSYTQKGRFQEALDLFAQMRTEGVEPDGFTFVSVLSACSHLGALEIGKRVHSLIRDWSQMAINVGTSLVEMYAKCGDIRKAFTTFVKLGEKDVFCYNVMIKALAIHGRAEDAIKIFYMMQMRGLKPNEVTLSNVLYACSHGGLVAEGRKIFRCMETQCGVARNLEHYGCMVDLLSRNGRVEEARLLVEEMPFKPDIAVWGALLNGCRLRGDLKSAKSIIKKADRLKSNESGVYVLLSNIQASADQWSEAAGTRVIMDEKSIWKKTGNSYVL